MCTFCGADCTSCPCQTGCRGCAATGGNPFGAGCLAAEYIKLGGTALFEQFKKVLIDEFCTLHVDGMPEVTALVPLVGKYVNVPYRLPNGKTVTVLKDDRVYLGSLLKVVLDEESGVYRTYGIVADTDFLLVAELGLPGENAELLAFQKRA